MSFDQLFLRLYSFQFFLLLLCAFFYFKAAEMEDASPLLWAGLSVAVYLVTWMVLNWGILACNDDACGAGGTRSEVSFPVQSGGTYLIRIGSPRFGTGEGTLVIDCAE